MKSVAWHPARSLTEYSKFEKFSKLFAVVSQNLPATLTGVMRGSTGENAVLEMGNTQQQGKKTDVWKRIGVVYTKQSMSQVNNIYK